MKKYLLVLFFLVSNFLNAQSIGVERTMVKRYFINSESLLYNKVNEKQITYEEFEKLLKNNPKLIVEVKEEDVDGNPISFYIVKSNYSSESSFNKVPHINRKDINNKIFKLDNDKNKKTLIILQGEFHFPAINVTDLKTAEDLALKKNNFNSVILTYTDKNVSKKFAIEQGFKSIIIPNAINLINKFGFKRAPVYIITDSIGNILEFTYYSDELESLLNEY